MRCCFKLIGCWALALAACAGAGPGDASGQAASVVRVDRRSGRLVRMVVTRPGSGAAAGLPVAALVEESAQRHQVDPLLVHSMIRAESNYNPFAVSPKGAEGLMQLMPATARRWGVNNSFDPAENLEGGVRYLRYLLDLFGEEKLAVAAYNAGEQAVIRYGGVPPYPETLSYVRQVGNSYAGAKQSAPPAAAAPKAPPEPEFRPLEQYFDERGNVHLRTR